MTLNSTKFKPLTCSIVRSPALTQITKLPRLICIGLFALATMAASFRLPRIANVAPNPDTFHLSIAWDTVSNADAYAVIVRSNGFETARVWTINNFATVSNLSAALDPYRFSVIATNSAGESPESVPATLRWMNVLESDSPSGPWTLLATNSFVPSAPQHFGAFSNWNAQTLLRKD